MTTASPAAPEAPSPVAEKTAPALWRYALAERRQTPAYLREDGTTWTPVTWEEAGEQVDALAHALLARGVGRGDAVAVLARTRVEWALLDWAVMSIGAVVVGLYPTNSAKECAYILEHSESLLVFVEDETQRAKVDEVRAELPALRDVLEFDALGALLDEGRAYREANPGALDAVQSEVAEDDLATLIYTSGTTGPPKGCMLTHRNLVVAATRVDRALTEPDDVLLLFLPLAHSFGRLVHQAGAFHGYTIAFVAEATAVARALEQVHPTVIPAVPRVYEKIHAGVLAGFEQQTGAKRRLVDWALAVGSRASVLKQARRPLPPLLRAQVALADRLVYSKVKQRLGGRLRVGISGAAPLSRDVLEFFHALDILIVEGYGLTETSSSTTVNHVEDFRFGTVGQPVPGCELKLDADGEILVRSETIFSGYFKEPDATRAAFTDDGWFRTGDVGMVDEAGFVRITDRKKDLIITAGGKNIAPQNIENALKTSRFVSQAVVIGDRRPYVTALITLDEQEVEATGRDPQELVQEIVDDVNRDRVRVEQIKRFAILPRDFSQEEGELTPTLKLRRRVVQEHFSDEIERLYS